MIIDLITNNQIQAYLDDGQYVILDFYADWCPPCRKFMPIFTRVSEDVRNAHIVFVKVNVDVFPEIAGNYKVASIPTLLFLSPKKNMKKCTSLLESDEFQNEINEYFS